MSKRTKDIIQRANKNYHDMILKEYSDLTRGVYSYITYFQVNDPLSRHDNSLENIHSPLGGNSPVKYRQINDAELCGVDSTDIMNEIVEKGLTSTYTGTGYFKPNTIIPAPGDYFVFDLEEINDHLFRVTDVQFSHPGYTKFYQITYELDPENVDVIKSMVDGEYVMVDNDPLNNGTADGGSILKSTDAITSENAQNLIDTLIQEYVKDYYDEDMNAFVYKSKPLNCYLWSGYLQHFLTTNWVLQRYNKKIMTDIYLPDINRFDNPNIYDEEIYRHSIFKSVETQRNLMDYESSYMFTSEEPLRTRNLPFFMSPSPYKLLDMGKDCPDMWVTGFPWLTSEEDKTFSVADKFHKFQAPEDLDDPEREKHIKAGDTLFFVSSDTKLPIGVYYVDKLGTVNDASANEIFGTESLTSLDENDNEVQKYFKSEEDALLVSIVKAYINKELTITGEDIEVLKDYYYKYSLRNYILIPVIIYILKKQVEKIGEDK